MPEINEMSLKLEGFQYDTSLDLNKGDYHILLINSASNLSIILMWGKYCYKRITMGVYKSPDIYQQKMDDLFCGFEFILT